MSGLKSLPIQDILARGSISETDVARFRRIFFEDGIVSSDEADVLLQINGSCRSAAQGWSAFVVEAVTDYLVFQAHPQGYVTADNAHWLFDRIERYRLADGRLAIDLAVNVLEKARWAPVSLTTFALEQVKRAVVTGTGPLRAASGAPAGTITVGEVDLLRRILYAFGGDGHIAVTRDEADVLFDIDEAVENAEPNAAWTDLFVKAVANVIMSTSGYAVPSREEALRQETSLTDADQKTSVLAFLLSMVRSNLSAVRDAYHDQTIEERALARLEHQRIEIITNETITEAEASWLAGRLIRDGRLSPSETALVAYLRQETPRIHPVLVEAVERVGHAA